MYDGIKPVSYMLGLVGDNITTSLTPPIHEMIGRAMGMSVTYRLIDLAAQDIGPDDLADTLTWARWFGFSGLNIIVLRKQFVIPLLDDFSERARPSQAANTVVLQDGKAIGHNTDWYGFAFLFRRNLPGAKADNLVLMGAGGAGSAVAYGMLDAGANTTTIFDIIPERETALVERMTAIYGPGRAFVGVGVDPAMTIANPNGVTNVTTRGMTGHEAGSSILVELLRPEMQAVDYVYLPVMTEFLQTAKKRGCRILSGTGMAAEQAAEAFRLFTGVEVDPKAVYSTLDALLAATSSR